MQLETYFLSFLFIFNAIRDTFSPFSIYVHYNQMHIFSLSYLFSMELYAHFLPLLFIFTIIICTFSSFYQRNQMHIFSLFINAIRDIFPPFPIYFQNLIMKFAATQFSN